MSKMIKLTPECLAEIRKDFESSLQGAKIADGKISYTKTFGYINRKATVYFTEMAWLKMQTLIREFDKEVAWHGVAYRGEDESKDEYYITDILVYPQEVTGATVNTDQEKYEMWLMMHEDDVFNNIRMQGHSHVNMGTTPSGVDTTHQEKILAQLEDDMFYIFMIWNKRGEKTIKIYDLAKNILFDGTDVTVEVKDDGTGMSAFLAEAKKMVQDKKPVISTTTNGYRGGYGGYYGGYSGNYGNTGNTGGKKEDKKTEEKKQSPPANSSGSGKKRKGKRKGGSNPNNACSQSQLTLFNGTGCDYDDIDDPYGAFGYRGEGYWG